MQQWKHKCEPFAVKFTTSTRIASPNWLMRLAKAWPPQLCRLIRREGRDEEVKKRRKEKVLNSDYSVYIVLTVLLRTTQKSRTSNAPTISLCGSGIISETKMDRSLLLWTSRWSRLGPRKLLVRDREYAVGINSMD